MTRRAKAGAARDVAAGACARASRTRAACRRAARAFALLSLAALLATTATAQESAPREPPPDAVAGEDYAYERADSLEDDALELGLGATGRPGSAPERTRRVRFRGDGVSGGVREGKGDALSGAGIEGTVAGGTMNVGRLAPRWGRGLVLGAASEPWAREPDDRGGGSRFSGRAGEGARFRRQGERASAEIMAGRFSRRDLAALALRAGPLGFGALAGGGGTQSSLAIASEQAEVELALARRGQWRAEAAVFRARGPTRITLRGRGGHAGFRSLAEPRRAGPAQAMAIEGERLTGPLRLAVSGALWKFRPQVSGARAALEVDRRLAEHGALVLGFEEQHGSRREPPARAAGFRQGMWGEWRAQAPGLAMALRHDVWGERAVIRAAVRAVTVVRIQAGTSPRPTLGLTHAIHRVRGGETVYLPEAGTDRLVLRALSGSGERTRFELGLPAGGGALRATLEIVAVAEKPPRLQWTFDWTRRARTRAAPTPGRGPPDP